MHYLFLVNNILANNLRDGLEMLESAVWYHNVCDKLYVNPKEDKTGEILRQKLAQGDEADRKKMIENSRVTCQSELIAELVKPFITSYSWRTEQQQEEEEEGGGESEEEDEEG